VLQHVLRCPVVLHRCDVHLALDILSGMMGCSPPSFGVEPESRALYALAGRDGTVHGALPGNRLAL
jgi:hypothetical protein